MTANTPQSRKSKRRRLQQEVVEYILDVFKFLHPSDVQSTSMGAPGVDIKLSKAAQDVFPFAIECKATEKINLWEAWKQAESNAGELNPLLVHRKNRTEAIAVVRFDYLLELHADCDRLAKELKQLQQK